MISLIGHTQNKVLLERHLPTVSLFLGPEAVGKRTLAEYLVQLYSYQAVDVLRVMHLDAQSARGIVGFTETKGIGVLGKLVILNLDGASQTACNILLKLLEETPSTRFILLASEPVLPPIMSRSQVFTFGLLSESDLTQIYLQQGQSESDAAALAGISSGQVQSEGMADPIAYKAAVLAVVSALRQGDLEILRIALKGWDEEKQRLFELWCLETILGRHSVFEESTAVIAPPLAMLVLSSLRKGNRLALMMEVALTPILKEIREGRLSG